MGKWIVPAEVLYVLNNEVVARCAGNLAVRVLAVLPSNAGFDQRLNYCYWLSLARALFATADFRYLN